jgi:hypothetical protein
VVSLKPLMQLEMAGLENTAFVPLFAVLINALHAALEDGEIAFNRVRGDGPANIFLEGVVDRFVARKILVEAALRRS